MLTRLQTTAIYLLSLTVITIYTIQERPSISALLFFWY